MKTQLTITELTRMQHGHVCVAGYDTEGRCIRPVLPPPGIGEQSLIVNDKPVAYPFAVVEYSLLEPTPQPPHTEDYRYDPQSVRFIRALSSEQRKAVLQQTLSMDISSIFDQEIHTDHGFYVADGQGPRSLGTIVMCHILKVIYAPEDEGAWDYRLIFEDGANEVYRLKITDLTWHYFCDLQRSEDCEPHEIAAMLTALLKKRLVYLRIGLARKWAKFPDRCYLQITGIHTFPDYLSGRTFADLAPYRRRPSR